MQSKILSYEEISRQIPLELYETGMLPQNDRPNRTRNFIANRCKITSRLNTLICTELRRQYKAMASMMGLLQTYHLKIRRSSISYILQRHMAKKVVDCWMPVCGVVIKRIKPDDPREKCRVTNFLKNNLFSDDPLMIAAGVNKNEPDPGLLQYYYKCINEGNSLYALIQNTREIVGASINRRSTRNTARELKRAAQGMVFKETSRYVELLSVVEDRVSVYNAFDVKEALSIENLVTGRPFRQRGVAKLLLKAVKDMAESDKKFNLIKFFTANTYAGHAAHACSGMRLHSFRNPLEYRSDKGEQLIYNELCLPHKSLEVFVLQVGRGKLR